MARHRHLGHGILARLLFLVTFRYVDAFVGEPSDLDVPERFNADLRDSVRKVS